MAQSGGADEDHPVRIIRVFDVATLGKIRNPVIRWPWDEVWFVHGAVSWGGSNARMRSLRRYNLSSYLVMSLAGRSSASSSSNSMSSRDNAGWIGASLIEQVPAEA